MFNEKHLKRNPDSMFVQMEAGCTKDEDFKDERNCNFLKDVYYLIKKLEDIDRKMIEDKIRLAKKK
mgnify:CR=1 FL=1